MISPIQRSRTRTLSTQIAGEPNFECCLTLNRVQTLTIELLKRHARHRLRQIEAQVTSLDAAIATVMANDPALTWRREILLSIPGLGYVTAQTLLADMPELGTMDEAQAASLAGLAPITRQSGKWQGKSFICGGRVSLRKALYMPALVAMRFNPDLKRVYSRLVDSGKHAKLAITAVMREVVGLHIGPSEAETFWSTFLKGLLRRGLHGVKLVISDAHEGLKSAIRRTFSASWQRCRLGLLRNLDAAGGKPLRISPKSLVGLCRVPAQRG